MESQIAEMLFDKITLANKFTKAVDGGSEEFIHFIAGDVAKAHTAAKYALSFIDIPRFFGHGGTFTCPFSGEKLSTLQLMDQQARFKWFPAVSEVRAESEGITSSTTIMAMWPYENGKKLVYAGEP